MLAEFLDLLLQDREEKITDLLCSRLQGQNCLQTPGLEGAVLTRFWSLMGDET